MDNTAEIKENDCLLINTQVEGSEQTTSSMEQILPDLITTTATATEITTTTMSTEATMEELRDIADITPKYDPLKKEATHFSIPVIQTTNVDAHSKEDEKLDCIEVPKRKYSLEKATIETYGESAEHLYEEIFADTLEVEYSDIGGSDAGSKYPSPYKMSKSLFPSHLSAQSSSRPRTPANDEQLSYPFSDDGLEEEVKNPFAEEPEEYSELMQRRLERLLLTPEEFSREKDVEEFLQNTFSSKMHSSESFDVVDSGQGDAQEVVEQEVVEQELIAREE